MPGVESLAFSRGFTRRARAAMPALLLLAAASGCDCEDSLGRIAPGVTLVDPAGEPEDFEREIDFGAVRVASLATRTLVFRNDGRASARITKAELQTDSPDFALGQTELPLLAPGATWELEVRYLPNEIGADSATVVVETDVRETPQYTVHVAARGAASEIEVCTTGPDGERCSSQAQDGVLVVDVGEARPGTELRRPLVVKNLGDAKLIVTGMAPTPSTSPEFSLAPEFAPFAVEANANKPLEVVYLPQDGGDDEGAIEILSDDPDEPRVLVQLRAVGLAPRLCVDPLAVDFGEQSVGGTARRTVKLLSCGRETATVTSVSIFAGDRNVFALASPPSAALVLAPGQSHDLEVTYAPTAFGDDTGRVIINTDVPGQSRGFVDLRGRGVGCTISVSPSPVNFGNVSQGGTASRTIQLRSTGTGTCQISEIRPPAAPFTIDRAPTLPLALPPGQVETLVVKFSPTSAATANSQVVLVTNEARGDIPIPLSARGITPPPCDLQPQPSSLVFTGVSTGQTAQQPVLLKNFGSASCFVSNAEIVSGSSPAFTVQLPGSGVFQPVEVTSGQQISVPVKFTPMTANVHTGTLRFTYSEDDFPSIPIPGFPAQGTKLDVPLEGGTLAPQLCLTPEELDFGTVGAGNLVEQSFTIQSCGQGALQVRGLSLQPGSSTDFSLVSPPRLPTFLPPGQSVQVRVAYKPRTTAGDFGAVQVLNNDPARSQAVVKLRGNAQAPCDRQLACTTRRLQFPTMEIGRSSSMSVVCRNVGTQAVTVNGVRFTNGSSPEFRATAGRVLPLSVAAGAALRLEVSYVPQDAGADTGGLIVDANTCVETRVDVEGAGKQPNYPRCPSQQVFQPARKWSWSGGSTNSDSKNVEMAPVVINLNDDNADGRIDENDVPDVAFTSCKSGECCIRCFGSQDFKTMDLAGKGMLRAVHGRDGRDLWAVTDTSLALTATTQLAAGDIDGDNIPEVVAVKHHFQPGTGSDGMKGKYKTGTLLVFDNTGRLKFETEQWTGSEDAAEQSGAPTLGDIDGDGLVEIFFEQTIFNSNGTRLRDLSHSGNDGHGAFATLIDLDRDGQLDIVSGHRAFKADGTLWWTVSGVQSGINLVVDTDGDGKPELVLRDRPDQLKIVDALTGQVKGGPYNWAMPTNAEGGTESICSAAMAAADLDGDRLPEIIIPSGDKLIALKPTTGRIMWTQPITDYGGQCGASGAAAFDFEGDGKYEVVYHDTAHMYVFRGTDGTKIYDAERNSSTLFETPVIADVDNDGHADLVMTNENGILGIGSGQGVVVLSDVGNQWPATRRVWNQHSYHVSDVNENGSIPRVESPHYTTTNSWRAQHSLCTPR